MATKNMRVLVVDDMKSMRMAVKKKLKVLDITDITEADDGSTAWSAIEDSIGSSQPFAMILSDWNMPNTSGIELLAKVRSDPRTKQIPFVLVTAESEKDQVMQAVKLGVTTYLTKPFTQETFNEKMDQVFRKMKVA
ncbi:MAG: response regulator [Deltaproteobacteria bacterium]|nr:response regulator [Deltaproteobacteria bacterium]